MRNTNKSYINLCLTPPFFLGSDLLLIFYFLTVSVTGGQAIEIVVNWSHVSSNPSSTHSSPAPVWALFHGRLSPMNFFKYESFPWGCDSSLTAPAWDPFAGCSPPTNGLLQCRLPSEFGCLNLLNSGILLRLQAGTCSTVRSQPVGPPWTAGKTLLWCASLLLSSLSLASM